MRRGPGGTIAALLVALAMVVLAPPARAQEGSSGAPGKVLLVTAPGLRWADLADHDLPNIETWLGDAAVAMLSLRTLGARTAVGEGYATMGSGNRASVSASIAGLALEPGEHVEEGTAAQAFERRTGVEPTGALLHLGYPAIERANRQYLYGARPGALAEALRGEGRGIGVVANADLGIGLATDPAAVPPAVEDVPAGEDPEAGLDAEQPAEEPPAEEPAPIDEVVEDEEPSVDVPEVEPSELSASQYGRAAALVAMDHTGQVAVGEAGGLLRRDGDAPYGVRYHPPSVERAVGEVLEAADVAVVELSDLDRADSYRREAAGTAAQRMWTDALTRSDELFGSLVEGLDPGTTVILATPAPPRAAETLGVFAMGTAGGGDGAGHLARSGTTRRPGYVSLPDLAPTILDHFDIDQPSSMTGTVIRPGRQVAVGQARFDAFAGTTAEARFRDRATGPVSVVFVIVQIVAYALAAVAVARRRRWVRPVSYLALVVLATPPIGFLAGVLHVESGDLVTYVLAVFAGAIVLAAAAEGIGTVAGRRWPRTRATLAPLLLVALSWLLMIVDVMTGSRLQINTVFGYSPLVAGRFAGFGNLAFAIVGVGAVVVACGAWATLRLARAPADGSTRLRGGAALAVVAFLAFTVVVDGAPMWGSDVGGVLATVPGFAVLVLVAMGVRVDLKRAIAIGVATLAALAAFAAIDLSRPEEDRTHLGRLVDRVLADDGGGGGFAEVVQRKLTTNLNILTSSIWTLTIPFALGLLIYLARRRRGFLRELQEQVPGIRPMLAGGLLVAVLGFALNDSGVAVPAMMFAVLLPYLTYVLLRWDPARP